VEDTIWVTEQGPVFLTHYPKLTNASANVPSSK
jgi:Xaa-Pro aminopeptidase